MAETATGVAFLVLAAAGGLYIYSFGPAGKEPLHQKKQRSSALSARAENASESQIQASNVLEAASPTLEGGIRNSGRMLERVISTRLAQSWRNSELPGLQIRHGNVPADELLVRTQSATRGVYEDTMHKLSYIYNPDRQRPVIQGRIRGRFQTTNFLN